MKKEIEQLLNEAGLKPNKVLGQNFLIDKNILNKIIVSAGLSKEDAVLEVGPGLGVLTRELAKNAGKVIAVEKDKFLADILENTIKKENIENINIIREDILELKESELPENYKLVANIPYYLTSPLIRKFLEAKKQPKEIILMVQKEVAQRICAKPPKMSLLAISVQFYAEPKILFNVSKGSFWPSPKVDSAVIRIAPNEKPAVDPEKFFKLVKAGFLHPRKQLINNLNSLNIEKEKIISALEQLSLFPKQRPETLKIEDWIKLTEILIQKTP